MALVKVRDLHDNMSIFLFQLFVTLQSLPDEDRVRFLTAAEVNGIESTAKEALK